jgi:4-amino-4-deoxy-L-arabinose transferase and related glycosyltransferases of PMT family
MSLTPNRNRNCNFEQEATCARKLPAAASDCPHAMAVFLLALAVYLWSMPHTVVIDDDDGYFITAAFLNVYAHPPGYPLYCLLGKLATMFPLGSIAYRVHALSALCGALACSVLWCLTRYLVDNQWLAWLSSLGLAFSSVFWSSSIVAEVYSLNILLFLVISLLLLRYAATDRISLLCWSAFIYGLSLSNHWPLLLLSSPALLMLLWPVRGRFVRDMIYALPCMLLGLTPYVWMVLRSHAVPELNFDGPFHTWAELWTFLSRSYYADLDVNPGAGWTDRIQFLWYSLQLTLTQYGYIGGLFILVGFLMQWRAWPRHIGMALLFGYLGSTLFLILLLRFDYDYYHQAIFKVYPHIAFAICSFWLALGCGSAIEWLANRIVGVRIGLITCLSVVLILATEFAWNAPENYRAGNSHAEDYARALMESLPKGAILYANAGTINGPAGYLQKVLGERPDIILYTGHNLLIDGRLHRLYKQDAVGVNQLVARLLESESRPVYYTNDFPHSCAADDYGLYFHVSGKHCDRARHTVLHPQIIHYFGSLLTLPVSTEPWERMHTLLLYADYCRLLLNYNTTSAIRAGLQQGDNDIALSCGRYHGALTAIAILLDRPEQDWGLIDQLLERAEEGRHEALTREESSRIDYLRGEMWRQRQNHGKAEISYRKALHIWDHPRNPARKRLLELSIRP